MDTMEPINVIGWPVNDPRYSHTGEGGMYAMAVVPLPDPSEGAMACSVDTYTSLTRPDVCVSPEAAQVWEREKDWTGGSDAAVHSARQKLEAAGHKAAADALSELIGYDDLSVPVLAAVHLGSTSTSLYDEGSDVYFTVAEEHLTAPGRALYEALATAHRTRPLLLTFLDT